MLLFCRMMARTCTYNNSRHSKVSIIYIRINVIPEKTAGEKPNKVHTAAIFFLSFPVSSFVIPHKTNQDNTKNTKLMDNPCHFEKTPFAERVFRKKNLTVFGRVKDRVNIQ